MSITIDLNSDVEKLNLGEIFIRRVVTIMSFSRLQLDVITLVVLGHIT